MVIHGFVFTERPHLTQLFCEDVFGNGGLCDVCPVQIVHAVRPYGSALQLDVIRLGVQEEVPVSS